MSYQLILDIVFNLFGIFVCDGIEESREGIEFSIRSKLNTTESHWIPLKLSYFRHSSPSTSSTTVVRGYEIPVQFGRDSSPTNYVRICGDVLLTNEVQFRWMGTADLENGDNFRSDVWALANVNAVFITPENERVTLIHDTFGENILK